MKNDFREFYDKDYILHSMSEEEYIAHGEWANNLRKYIDKVRTRSGKWKYIYPEDKQKPDLKTRVKQTMYNAGAAVSKLTGQNSKFKKTMQNRAKEEYAANNPAKPTNNFTLYNGRTVRLDDRGNIYTKKQRVPNYEQIQRQSRQGLAKYNKRREDQLAAEARNAITTRPRKKFKGTITELREQRAAQNQNALAIKKKRTYSNTVPSQFKKKRKAR